MWVEGGQTSGRQEAGKSWGLLVGLLEELLEGTQEEQAAGYQDEGMTVDQVIRLVWYFGGWGGKGGRWREGFWQPGVRQDLRPGSMAG